MRYTITDSIQFQENDGEMKQITRNIFTEDQFSVPPALRGCNPSYVTTSDGIVVVDGPMHPIDSIRWRNEFLAKCWEVKYIINTHHHVDHITGNAFLPGAIISHQGVFDMFDPNIPAALAVAADRVEEIENTEYPLAAYTKLLLGEREEINYTLLEGYKPRRPTITFNDELTLYSGEHSFKCYHMPGHTPSHIGVYCPEEKVFFAGDNFTTKTQASLAHCLPLEWVESLKKVEAMDINLVVPGHGEVCEKSIIPEFRHFIETCIEMVQDALKKGMSKEETADDLNFENLYPGGGGAEAVHPGAKMQRRNVLRLYEVLSNS
ncbi:MBL fold metallo-hydrolase [Chloroflexota bacterium]